MGVFPRLLEPAPHLLPNPEPQGDPVDLLRRRPGRARPEIPPDLGHVDLPRIDRPPQVPHDLGPRDPTEVGAVRMRPRDAPAGLFLGPVSRIRRGVEPVEPINGPPDRDVTPGILPGTTRHGDDRGVPVHEFDCPRLPVRQHHHVELPGGGGRPLSDRDPAHKNEIDPVAAENPRQFAGLLRDPARNPVTTRFRSGASRVEADPAGPIAGIARASHWSPTRVAGRATPSGTTRSARRGARGTFGSSPRGSRASGLSSPRGAGSSGVPHRGRTATGRWNHDRSRGSPVRGGSRCRDPFPLTGTGPRAGRHLFGESRRQRAPASGAWGSAAWGVPGGRPTGSAGAARARRSAAAFRRGRTRHR